MLNQMLRLTALSIFVEKLLNPHRSDEKMVDTLSDAELDSLYGISGDMLLDRMGTFDFAPGAVNEMMVAIEAAFEQEPEGDE